MNLLKKYDDKSISPKKRTLRSISWYFQKIRPFSNNKPTIAMQVTSMDKGGLEEVVLQLAMSKRIKEKYNVVIITESSNKGYLANIARHNGIYVYSFFKDISYYEKLIKTLNIKLIHFHFNITGIQILKELGIKSLYTIHNTYIWLNDYHINLRKSHYKLVDKFVAVSSNVKDYFIEKFNIDDAKIKTITNGIEYFDSTNLIPINRSEIGLRGNDFVFLNVTSFSSRKYHFPQVEALHRLKNKYPNIRLIFLGNIEDQLYYSQLMDFIKQKKVQDQIKIVNYVSKDKVYSYLKTANVFIMTSLAEGFSIATLEAMLMSKPMILTDTGGARDVIQNNDIGIVVKHAFSNLEQLNINDIEIDNKNKIYHFDNIDEIVRAMEDMYLNYNNWSNKAESAKNKIKSDFNLEKVITQYIEQYDELIKEYQYEDIESLIEKENFEILVLAPYPHPKIVNEGWMSRIKAIDNIILDKKRLYITPLIMDKGKNIKKFGDNVFEIQIPSEHFLFKWVIDLAIYKTKLTYCHTLNFAEFILPWLNTGKIIVDIHGITAEEEVMLGRPQNKEKYEKIEYEVLKKAKYCVMVTNAMKIHYKNKYPQLAPNCIILPIVEKIDIDESMLQKANSNSKEIIYSGGIQVWQNLDGMLSFAAKVQKNAHFTFLSAQYKEIQKKAKKLKIKNANYAVASKEELKEIYQNATFGLVFRNDSPVNFVSCPTKLYDYMVYGIIPIVRTIDMGDFKELGFRYCTENDILNNKFPTAKEREEIIIKNFQIVKKMQALFKNGSEKLRSELCFDSFSCPPPPLAPSSQ